MTDCLLLGFYDPDFSQQVELLRSMGEDSGAYRDLALAFVGYQGRPWRALDLLNHFHFEGGQQIVRPFHNADFLWPALLYLGSYLHRHGHSFDYINLPHLEKAALLDRLEQGDLRTVAITTTLYVAPQPILELVELVRGHAPGAKIVIGGPYIANQIRLAEPAEVDRLLKFLGADFYVIEQEGEETLSLLLEALKAGANPAGVPNLAYIEAGRVVRTPTRPEDNPLATNPLNYDLFPRRAIGEFLSLRTAKSCPFACSFCGFPQRAGKYRYLEVDAVLAELDRVAELGTVTTLTFLDDTFNVPKKRFESILRGMIDRGYGWRWNSFYRSDHGDAATIELMSRAGCEGVFLGVESGSDAMLQRMNKTARRRHYLEAIPQLAAAGISTHANLIVGFPGETLDTLAETVSLLEETRPDYFRAQLWYGDPITPIWARRAEYGVSGQAFNWSHDTMNFEQACDLVDELFMGVCGAEWLPQNGFEQWSTFYLQRRGMSRRRIKAFVHTFNQGVRGKLRHPGQPELAPELVAELRRLARFQDTTAASDDEPRVELYPAPAAPAAPSPQPGAGSVMDTAEQFRF